MEPVRSIVLAVDFSAPSQAATERAALLAEGCAATLHLVHSARLPMPAMTHEFAIPGPEWETIRAVSQKQLEALAAELEQRGLDVTHELSRSSQRLPNTIPI